MTNKDIAEALEEVGALLELNGENQFKIRAYQNGARIVRGVSSDLEQFVAEARAGKVKGIGPALRDKIATLYETETLPYLEELRSSFPEGLLELLNIPGLGAKKIRTLYNELEISSLAELKSACEQNKLAELKGFGVKTQENILKGIAHRESFEGQYRFSEAWAEAKKLLAALRATKLTSELEVAGSLRRRKPVVKDIDIIATSDSPDRLMEAFVQYEEGVDVKAHGATKSAITLRSGISVDLRVVSKDEFAPALAYFTGSKEHNTAVRSIAQKKGYKLNEYGLFSGEEKLETAGEAEIYQELELCYIPAELREVQGEIEEAQAYFKTKKSFPRPLETSDIKGILHCHTTYSDGKHSLEQMVTAAKESGFEYIGITDHSQSAAYAGGLKAEQIQRQHEEIDQLNEALAPFRIFKGIESDILVDGALDYPDEILESFDFIVASVHSRFQLSEKEMTKRLIAAVENPYTTILGHSTGRLLLKRDGYPVNLPAVLEAAAAAGTAIEINANPRRLDLDWQYYRRAKELGIAIPICPDAHSIEGMKDIEYGVGVARKGGLTTKDILTCWPRAEVAKYFERKTSR